MTPPTILAAALLPESMLHTHWFSVLASFVAINTILYVSLSIFKIMPKLYRNDIVKGHRPRSETRSIYPNGVDAKDAEPDSELDELDAAARRVAKELAAIWVN